MSARRAVTNHGRIRRAALFMLLALAAEVASLAWRHPLSIYVFGAVGALLVLFSITSVLLSLVSPPAEVARAESGESDEEERQADAA